MRASFFAIVAYCLVVSLPGNVSVEAQDSFIAYEVPSATVGNQDFGGALGHDFNVNAEILITRLGVFDSGSDGLSATITARVFDRDAETELASLEFTPEDPGDLVGASCYVVGAALGCSANVGCQ